MARDPLPRIEKAQMAFETGFASKAARDRALQELNRAYEAVRYQAHDNQIDHANDPERPTSLQGEARARFFQENDLPFDLHQVRDRHVVLIERWAGADRALLVRDMIALRQSIREAPLAPPKPVDEQKERVETIRRSILEEMERRHAQFVEGLELGRQLGGLPVTVNAHIVHGHKGAVFPRYFFYLNGKLTPLNTIVAIAQTLEDEKAAGQAPAAGRAPAANPEPF